MDADYIIPACDPHVTFKLLGGKYRDKKFEMRDKDPKKYFLLSSALYAFAVDYDMKGLAQSFMFETNLELVEQKLNVLGYKCYNHEPSFAPKGKSVMEVNVFSNYDFWKGLNKEQYEKVKAENGAKIISCIENKNPELKGKLKLLDVATPLTYERYCGSYKGSWMPWGSTPRAKMLMHKGRIKGIGNLFMAGQWLMPPGGLPLAVSGRWAVQRIMYKEKMDWRKL